MKQDKKSIGITNKIIGRVDTGWDCCVCDDVGRVMGDGFTWCKRHWETWDLGQDERITVASMRKIFHETR